MGNAASRVPWLKRISGRYNFENRAQKEIEKQQDRIIPKTAPRHRSTTKQLEEFAKGGSYL